MRQETQARTPKNLRLRGHPAFARLILEDPIERLSLGPLGSNGNEQEIARAVTNLGMHWAAVDGTPRPPPLTVPSELPAGLPAVSGMVLPANDAVGGGALASVRVATLQTLRVIGANEITITTLKTASLITGMLSRETERNATIYALAGVPTASA